MSRNIVAVTIRRLAVVLGVWVKVQTLIQVWARTIFGRTRNLYIEKRASLKNFQMCRTVLLAFINCLVISTPQLKERNRLRNEFIGEFYPLRLLSFEYLWKGEWHLWKWKWKKLGSKCPLKKKPFPTVKYILWVHKYFERRVKFEEAESAQGSWTRPLPICTELRKSE